MVVGLINANPVVYERKERSTRNDVVAKDEFAVEPIDQQEIFAFEGGGVFALMLLTLYFIFIGHSWTLKQFLSFILDFGGIHHVRDIKDPEHPYSLEQLKVISEDAIEVDDEHNHVRITFTPTVEHCSMATVIGLCLRVKLMRCLPSRFKVDIRVAPGTHATEAAVNKQLNDKERVAAALENPNLVEMVDDCLAPSND